MNIRNLWKVSKYVPEKDIYIRVEYSVLDNNCAEEAWTNPDHEWASEEVWLLVLDKFAGPIVRGFIPRPGDFVGEHVVKTVHWSYDQYDEDTKTWSDTGPLTIHFMIS